MAYFTHIISRDIKSIPEQVAVMFYHRNGHDNAMLVDALEKLTNRRLSPTRVLLVCPFGQHSIVKEHFDSLDKASRARLSVTSHIQILPYDDRGQPLQNEAVNIRGRNWKQSQKEFDRLVNEAFENLISTTGVVLTSPKGYLFKKPSSGKSRIFVRTGNMFKEPSALAITSLALMKSIPWEAETIYIDSFTILSAVLAFVRDREALAKDLGIAFVEPTIVNLHSYDIDPNLRFPGHTQYAVLISASTSGNLAKSLVENHGANRDLIHHMLIFSPDTSLHKNAIYVDKSPLPAPPPPDEFRREISIPGEEFIASSSEPHAVNITTKHFSPHESSAFVKPYYQKALTLNLSSPGQSAYSLISLSEEDGENNDVFTEWLSDEIEYSIPVNTSWILAVDSHNSLEFAKKAAALLKSHIERDLPVYTLDNLDENISLPEGSDTRTILVVAANTGLGEELLSASRRLRDFTHKHRHYLIGHVFPESDTQYDRLQKNLRVSGRNRRYGWTCFLASPLGRSEAHDSWLIESKVIKKGIESDRFSEYSKKLQVAISKRMADLDQQSLSGHCVFLPTPKLQDLKLRDESVLFREEYENISQVTVYVMVSAALQRARDHKSPDGKKLDESECFHGSPFIISVLDPDMFSRYNDGIIQSAFLRASSPDELNYANHLILSRNMRDIVIAAINHHKSDAGEAVLEMLLALATKRLRVDQKHYEEIVAAINKTKLLREFWSLLKTKEIF